MLGRWSLGGRRRGWRQRDVWVWNSFYQRNDGGGWTAWVEPLDNADMSRSPLAVLVTGATAHATQKELTRQLSDILRTSSPAEADAFRQGHARLFAPSDMPLIEWPPPAAFHSILQRPSKVARDHQLAAAVAPASDVVVSLQHAWKSYGQAEALRGVTVNIQRGEVVALLGPNGAGKTTAVNLMLGLRRTTRGSVTLFGGSPTSLAARSRCGVMLQEAGLPGTLRVREIVDLFRSYYPSPMATDEVLHIAGIAHKERSLVTRMSGGERQRLYFALSLCGDPELLFLDEPTAGLDVEARQAFLGSIRAFAALHKTVLMTTHYLDEAEAVADRIIVVNHGRVVADGSPGAIKAGFGKKRVAFLSGRPVSELAFSGLPVARLEIAGHRVRLLSDEPEAVLRVLFDRGVDIRELEVSSAGLQEAFLALIDSGATKGQTVA